MSLVHQKCWSIIKKDLRKFVKNTKVLPSNECITQHKQLTWGFERYECSTRCDFNSCVKKFKESSKIDASEGYWKALIGALLEAYSANGLGCLIHKDMVIEMINKMKNGKTAGPSGLGSETAKSADKTTTQ